MYFSHFGNVINIDLNIKTAWFPTSADGFLQGSTLRSFPQKLERIEGNIFQVLPAIDKKFDFIYDSCSMIHFRKYENQLRDRPPLEEMFGLIHEKCHSETLFISCTDLAHVDRFELHDLIFEQKMTEAAANAGFDSLIIIGNDSYSNAKDINPVDRNIFSGQDYWASMLKPIESFLCTYYPRKSKFSLIIITGVYIFKTNELLNFHIKKNYKQAALAWLHLSLYNLNSIVVLSIRLMRWIYRKLILFYNRIFTNTHI